MSANIVAVATIIGPLHARKLCRAVEELSRRYEHYDPILFFLLLSLVRASYLCSIELDGGTESFGLKELYDCSSI